MQILDKSLLNPQQFGKRIRQARENKGMSQEALARVIEKDQSAISAYERGNRTIPLSDIIQIAEVLEMPLLYFVDEAVTEYDVENEILKYFQSLPTLEAKRIATEYVRLLAEALEKHDRS